MSTDKTAWEFDEGWWQDWDPARDEYGYPINTAMPAGLYVDHAGIIAKRWDPESGQWSEFHDLTQAHPSRVQEVIRRQPPELPFEALDFETRKAIRKDRSRGKIRPLMQPLASTVDPTGDARRQREKKAITGRRVGTIVSVAVVAALVGGFMWSTSRPSTGNIYDAQTACENAIKERLKSPSSASFSDMRYVDKDPEYTIRLSVDADNSFGASIRGTFTCEVQRTGKDYEVESVAGG